MQQGLPKPLLALAALLSVAGVLMAGRAAIGDLAALSREPAALIAQGVPSRLPSGAVIVARKPHLAFYAKATTVTVAANSLGELREELARLSADRPVFLFMGEAEATFRPGLSQLRMPEVAPPWLALVKSSGSQDQAANQWALYRFQP